MTPEQEELLGIAMAALARKEGKRAGVVGFSKQNNPGVARENGRLGGAPRTAKPLDMTARAATVNRMLLRGMSSAIIADILDTSERSVKDTATRYRLPRKNEEAKE